MKSFGYAINPPRVNDSSRETVVREMGKFTRVDDMVDAQVIAAIAADHPHIIIDLMGYDARFPHCVFVTLCAGTLMARKSACLLRSPRPLSSPGRASWAAAAAATYL